MTNIHVVLAAHNGERFLEDQLASLLAQTVPDWLLLIMDDGSSDHTPEIIDAAVARDRRVIRIEGSDSGTGSASAAFGTLLASSLDMGAEYILCCDQDDYWHPDKVRRMLSAIRAKEGSEKQPTLIHHDLEVVDSALKPIAGSYWGRMGLDPGKRTAAQRLLSRNEVTGCALVCNRPLLELALPIPQEAVMHDWWLALCAGFFGVLDFLPDRLVRYRQHGGNAIGAKSFWHGLNPFSNWAAGLRRGNEEFRQTVFQARGFRDRFRERLSSMPAIAASVDAYCKILDSPAGRRLDNLREAKAWRGNLILDTALTLHALSTRGNASGPK